MPDDKLNRLKKLNDFLNDGLTKGDFTKAFQQLITLITQIGQSLNAKLDARLAKIKDGKDGKDGRDGKDGKSIQGPKGDKGDPGTTYTLFGKSEPGAPGKDGSPDTPEQVRDKLETLEGDERLDAKYIKNLPKPDGPRIAPNPALWALADVDMAGIQIGQSIKWDSVRWIPYTPAGGTGTTAVYNEVVSGSGTSFTLANAPAVGTERVYANGQRLTPTVDYSIAGGNITTVSSWSSGSITCDYEY